MRAHFFAVAVLSTALTITSASATVLINGDNGGLMEDYTARFQQARQSGEPVVIDGPCFSACTMVLGLVPRDQVCATPNAILGFHAAWQFDKSGRRVASASGTRDLMKTYPASVRAWIARHGGLTLNTMYVRGRDLAAIVAPCAKPRARPRGHARPDFRNGRDSETSVAAPQRCFSHSATKTFLDERACVGKFS